MRPDLMSLTGAQRADLSSRILAFVTQGVLDHHSHFAHQSNVQLFLDHRGFLADLEAHLLATGGGQFVPLPTWNPATPIPAEFAGVKQDPTKPARPPLANLSPNRPLPSDLRPDRVRRFCSGDQLAAAVNPWHGDVHVTIGGTMAFAAISPAAAIFWPWHAFIDRIYESWERTAPEQGHLLHVAGVVAGGGAAHTIRSPNGEWPPFGDVIGAAGNRGQFVDLDCAIAGSELHTCAVTSDGWLWHTIRHPSHWDPFGDVKGQAGNPGVLKRVAVAGDGNLLHVCALTTSGTLWHTIRSPGSWTPFGNVNQQTSPQGTIEEFDCAVVNGELHVVAVIYSGGWFGTRKPFHTIRHAASWDKFGDVHNAVPGVKRDFKRVGTAEVAGELHLCGVGTNGSLWHTIRHANAWDSYGDVKGAVPSPDPGSFDDVDCANVNGELHVCGITSGGALWWWARRLWHTVRHANSWEPFGDVQSQACQRDLVSVATAGLFKP